MFFLPWWMSLACLAASALATYLLLERTRVGGSPWAIFPLTAVLAPAVLAGMMVVAIILSTLLSALLENRTGALPDEGTGAESTLERTVSATTSTPPSGSQITSPAASPTASPTASPASSPTASPAASPPP